MKDTNMNKENLFLSFSQLDQKLLEESEHYGEIKMKKKKIQYIKRTVIAVAAVLAIFVMVPNISPTAAMAMEKIPVLGALVKAVTFRDYSQEQDNVSIDLEVPHVEPEESTDAEMEAAANINVDIDRIANELIEEYQHTLEEEDPHLAITMNYETLVSTDKYFTLKLNCFEARGSGYEWNKFYTIDCATGKQLLLKDLFKDGADYITPISENIIEQMREQMKDEESGKIYFVDTDIEADNFKQIAADQNFYINEDNQLVIAFDEYEVAPGYMGAVEFVIPGEVTGPIMK